MVETGIPMNIGLIISFRGLITLPLSALMLWISGKIMKIDIGYVKALIPAAIMVVFGFLAGIPQYFLLNNLAMLIAYAVIIFLISIGLYLTIPKYFFNLTWGKGAIVGLIWYGLMLVIEFILGRIIAIIIGIVMAGTYAAMI